MARLAQSPPAEALIGGLLIAPTCSQMTSCECGHWAYFLVVSWCSFQRLWFLTEAFTVTSEGAPQVSHVHSMPSILSPGDTDVLVMD